jgi:hypothetical protein
MMTENSATSGTPADENEPVDETAPVQETEAAPVQETEAAPETEVFANRAARRAKGKSSAKPEILGKGQRPVGRGAVQSPRQYGNRRSG